MNIKKNIEVVAGVIEFDNKILAVQRPEAKYDYISKKYEFPGGKVEPNESQEEALIRELNEELAIQVKIEKKIITVTHEYPHFCITMHCFLCSVKSQNIQMNEHIDAKWLPIKELHDLDWAAADIPVVEKLQY